MFSFCYFCSEKYASRHCPALQHWTMFPFWTSGPFCSLSVLPLLAGSEFRYLKCSSRWISNGGSVSWGKAGGTCGGPEQASWELGSRWSPTGEILQGIKGLIPADVSKGESCPFVVNVNVKGNTRDSLLVVRVRGNIIITSRTRLKHVTMLFMHRVTFTGTFL